ncbi:hypothetical protein AWC38_SpisGene20943 [Stylophora pistillata]|uniref:Uncharacterized protein n=1 Tax=Stylophora pistillata TaxID=50429 RepID=A0A2B4RCI4_STYPI|nr:hypothetical protein AWC38_SpisGene20943 [Stylophora pistillata]
MTAQLCWTKFSNGFEQNRNRCSQGEQIQLADLLKDGVSSNREIRASRKELYEAQENVVEHLTSLIVLYSVTRDKYGFEKTSHELEEIEREFFKAQESVQEHLDTNKDELSSQTSGFPGKLHNLDSQETRDRQRVTELEERLREKEESLKRNLRKMKEEYVRFQKEIEVEVREAKEELAREKGVCKEKYSKLEGAINEEFELLLLSLPKKDVKPEEEKPVKESPKHELGKVMWKQLTRVSIPVFSGDKRSYGSWKAAFLACVDEAPAIAEYKLLHLKKCLSVEALAAVESLGHSAEAYEATGSRLESMFGGQPAPTDSSCQL